MKTGLIGSLAFIAGMIFVAGAGASLADDGDSTVESIEESGNERIEQFIADAFGISPEEVAALHEEDGLGYGVIVKLLAIAEAKGITIDELIATLPVVDGEIDPEIGELIAELTEEELEALKDLPTRLGPLVSSSDEDGDGDLNGDETDGEEDDETDGPGQGHESCSEATEHALERLKELQADGKPVDNAIAAIEQCGMGAGKPQVDDGDSAIDSEETDSDTEDDEDGNSNGRPDGVGKPEGVGKPDWAPGPPPWANNGGD